MTFINPLQPVSMNSPIDVNGRVIQYMQQDRANWYYACTQTAQSLSGAGPATTGYGLGLRNSSTNTVNLVIRSVQMALSAEPGAAAVIFYCKSANGNVSGQTTLLTNAGYNPIVTQLGLNFGVVGQAAAFIGGTLSGAPVIVRLASDVLTTTANQVALDDPINGQIILEPNTAFSIQSNAALTGYFSIVWEEVPQW